MRQTREQVGSAARPRAWGPGGVALLAVLSLRCSLLPFDEVQAGGSCGVEATSDLANCGSCGHVCPGEGAECVEGKCLRALVPTAAGYWPRRISIRPSQTEGLNELFFTSPLPTVNETDGELVRVLSDGTGLTRLTQFGVVRHAEATTKGLFVLDVGGATPEVKRLTSGEPVCLLKGDEKTTRLAAARDRVFVATMEGLFSFDKDATTDDCNVLKGAHVHYQPSDEKDRLRMSYVDIVPGELQLIWVGDSFGVDASFKRGIYQCKRYQKVCVSTEPFWSAENFQPVGLAASDGQIYWSATRNLKSLPQQQEDFSEVYRVADSDEETPAVELVARVDARIERLLVVGGVLYATAWVGADAQVWRGALPAVGSGELATLVPILKGRSSAFAWQADEKFVYWTERGDVKSNRKGAVYSLER